MLGKRKPSGQGHSWQPVWQRFFQGFWQSLRLPARSPHGFSRTAHGQDHHSGSSRRWRGLAPGLRRLLSLVLGIVLALAIGSPWVYPGFALEPLQSAQERYGAGDFRAAISLLDQAIASLQQQGDRLGEAGAWSNRSLALQQLGNWTEAEVNLTQALNLLQGLPAGKERDRLLAQAFEIQGRLAQVRGQSDAAAVSWEQAAARHGARGDSTAQWRSQLQQAQALQRAGLYRRSRELLQDLQTRHQTAPDSELKATTLRQSGEVEIIGGNTTAAQASLNEALAIAKRAELPQEIAASYLSLGNAYRLRAMAELGRNDLSVRDLSRLLPLSLERDPANCPARNLFAKCEATAKFKRDLQAALQAYRDAQGALANSNFPSRESWAIRPQVQELSVLVDLQDWSALQRLYPQLERRLALLPPGRDRLFDQLEWAQSLLKALKIQAKIADQPSADFTSSILLTPSVKQAKVATGSFLTQNSPHFWALGSNPEFPQESKLDLSLTDNLGAALLPSESLSRELEAVLQTVLREAKALPDSRSQAYALGILGELAEMNQQFEQARRLTEEALLVAQRSQAPEVAYRWYGQLGRIHQALQNEPAAIAAYQSAVDTLQALRGDLVAAHRDAQFSFRENVEPVYRQLVSLLLNQARHTAASPNSSTPTTNPLQSARKIIEGLQLAELDNFFRETCLEANFNLDRVVDQSNLATALVYTIVSDRSIDVVLKLPNQPLISYSTAVSRDQVEATVDEFRDLLKSPLVDAKLYASAQRLYNWLIRPGEAALAQAKPDTLVFVLDGTLRSIPMAALYDGQRYLVERYAVAIAPGLQLPEVNTVSDSKLRALAAGLSEQSPSTQGQSFPPLPGVETEIRDVQQALPGPLLLNSTFTKAGLKAEVDLQPFPIVHLATHGKFSSNQDETFVLAWDGPVQINELSQLLLGPTEREVPIELLVLSACQTASGDRRAALGLAGMAIRSGARSTLASLWSVNDASTVQLMQTFYKTFAQPGTSRAEALRQAQLALVASENYRSPQFWAPFVLLGNWR